MERSTRAQQALLDESWTTPWLDDGVFPYWPEAASMGDLEGFLQWLSVQDCHRAALVLTHPREFEKVHRLITAELTRSDPGPQRKDPPRAGAIRHPSTSEDGAVRQRQHRGRGVGEAKNPAVRSRSVELSRSGRKAGERKLSATGGEGAGGRRRHGVATPRSGTQSWPPPSSSSAERSKGGRKLRSNDVVVMPPPVRSTRRRLVPRPAVVQHSAWSSPQTSGAAAFRPSNALVAPQPRRSPRRWSNFSDGFTAVAAGGGGGGGSVSLEPTDAALPVPRAGKSRGQAAWATTASLAEPTTVAGAGRAGRARQVAMAATAAVAALATPNTAGAGGQSKKGRGGVPQEQSPASRPGDGVAEVVPSRPSSTTVRFQDGGGAAGESRRPPRSRPQQRRSLRGTVVDVRRREGGVAASLRRHLSEASPAVANTNASTAWDNDRGSEAQQHPSSSSTTTATAAVDSTASNGGVAGATTTATPTSQGRVLRGRRFGTPLQPVEEKGETTGEDAAESESWLCMRDPVSLREFWFDPKTRAAEWEGGGAMEDTPGGLGLGLLSEKDRERLRSKFERRQRRGRRASVAAAGAGGGRGFGLREQVLRKLTLEAETVGGDGGGAGAAVAGVHRGAARDVFFAEALRSA